MTPPVAMPQTVVPPDAANTEPLLRVRGLSTCFATPDGVLQAVEAVDLDVMRGECLGVVGESGSGKSVTFASVMGLVKPPGKVTAGSVELDGVELRQFGATAAPAAWAADRDDDAGHADGAQPGADDRDAAVR